jgi:hypothetical protein
MQIKWCQLIIIPLISTALAGCATVDNTTQKAENLVTRSHATKQTKKDYKSTNPNTVGVNVNPNKAFKKIGKVYVNRYNVWGIKRQTAVIYDLMQKQAAHIGGNAIIHVQKNRHIAIGTIIRYKPTEVV